jgi:heptaprenylglyceryl phosphate synthase
MQNERDARALAHLAEIIVVGDLTEREKPSQLVDLRGASDGAPSSVYS